MHKVNSPETMEKIVYKVRPDGMVDVWLRRNEELVPETEEFPAYYEADEVYFQLSEGACKAAEIEADFDFWFDRISQDGDGLIADALAVKNFRAARMSVVSSTCEAVIRAGVDVEVSGEPEHFSLTVNDQINLFGKQAQLAAGADKLEYHQDGWPCKFYTAEQMSAIIAAAMKYVSYHTTYCNSMFDWIKDCKKASEIDAITYGAEIPEKYQSEVLKEYLKGE